MKIGTSIRERRSQLGITQQNLADYAGISLRTVIDLESGKGNPSIRTVERVADVIGMTLDLKIKEIEV